VSLSMKSLVAAVSAYEQFVDGSALKYFRSDGLESADPRSIDTLRLRTKTIPHGVLNGSSIEYSNKVF